MRIKNKKARGALHIFMGGLEEPLPCGAGEAGWGCPSRNPLFLPFTCLSWLPSSPNQAKRKQGKG
jgi:hypothetical protein